jgi:uncharacterized protein (TIRG00374 family)
MEAILIERGEIGRMSSRIGKAVLGYGIPLALLVWIFHDLDWHEAITSLRGLRWDLVAAAVVVDILGYVVQALRWRTLLAPVGRLPLIRLVQAIYTGLFVNEILPMRTGEMVRAYLVSRWTSVRFRSVLPSMAVERLLDGVVLTLAIGLTTSLVPLPARLTEAAGVLGGVILVLTLVFVVLVLRTARRKGIQATPTPPLQAARHSLLKSVRRMLADVAEEVGHLGSGRLLSEAGFYSLLLLASQALSFWLLIRAAGFGLSVWAGAVVLLIVHLGTAIPNAPANIGSYQFFCILGLGLFGVGKSQATGLAFVIFLILTIPLWLLGWVALQRTQLSLAQIRVNTQRWRGSEFENTTIG